MGLLFGSYDGDETQAGHFRIGHVVLPIGVEGISTNKATADEELIPLRAKFPMYRKSGHSRWDVTLSWKALGLRTPEGSIDWSQWHALREILAIFKAAPFVEVENNHLRQILTSDPAFGPDPSRRMAFALKTLRIDTCDDLPLGLQATLTMSWFNYGPFSKDFAYDSGSGEPVSAYDSLLFADYIAKWKQENLDQPPNPFDNSVLAEKYGYPDMLPWDRQNPGDLSFTWRSYVAVPRSYPNASSIQAPPLSSTSAPPGPVSNNYQDNLLSVLASLIRQQEGWTVGAVNNGQRAGGSRAWRDSNPGNLETNRSEKLLYGAVGLDRTRIPAGNQPYLIFASDSDGWNALTGYLKGHICPGGSWCNKTFLQFFQSYAPASANNDPVSYAKRVVDGLNTKLGTSFSISTAMSQLWNRGDTQSIVAAQSAFASYQAPKQPSSTSSGSSIPADVLAFAASYAAGGWSLDYWTDRAVFLYQDHVEILSDLQAVKLSVVFVNTLASIPLSGQQYPTYQHLGPAGTLIVIGMLSPGDTTTGEALHGDLQALAYMCSTLEQQFQQTRGEWKSVSSIHRSQAVIVQNQVLNLLGIRGTLVRGFNTETVPESSNLEQAGLQLVQYENVYEQLDPYYVKGTLKAYQQILQAVADPDKLKAITGSQGGQNSVFAPLQQYAAGRQAKSTALGDQILRMLNDKTFRADLVPMPTSFTETEKQTLQQAFAASRVNSGAVSSAMTSWTWKHPNVVKNLTSGNATYNDYYPLVNGPQASDPMIAQVKKSVSARLPNPNPADGALCDQLLHYLDQTDPRFHQAVSEFQASPQVVGQMKTATQIYGPGQDQANQGHGAYKDLGLKDLNLAGKDFNPGCYFVDYGRQLQARISSEYGATAAAATAAAFSAFNAKAKGQTANVATQTADIPTNGMPGQASTDAKSATDLILSKTVVPYYSMARAFPTFKLFLIEEDNSGPFYMYDDFYSYGSVLDIDVIRYQDKPDTAIIHLTNFSNLLSHKAFDNSITGKRESALSNLQPVPSSSNGGPMAGPADAKIDVGKQGLLRASTAMDLTDGFSKQIANIPLQYYPLQTGAKIQIRMGYTNNPDLLFPVFTGKVTQIEGEEVLEIVAQGFLLELLDRLPEDSPTQWGGLRFMHHEGNIETVMDDMLTAPLVKHFGHWQIDPARGKSQFMKGFGWREAAGSLISAVGGSNLGSLLASGQDRKGINIAINRYVNADGALNSASGGVAPSHFDNTYLIFPPSYELKKDEYYTPWQVLKDISRRVPQYILKVEDFGFPLGCDATLVYADPNSFYINRFPIANELRLGRFDMSDDTAFRAWWEARGRARFAAFLGSPSNLIADSLAAKVIKNLVPSANTWDDMSGSVKQVMDLIKTQGVQAFQKAMQVYQDALTGTGWTGAVLAVASHLVPYTNSSMQRVRSEVLQLQQDLQSWLQWTRARQSGSLPTDPRPQDMVQPVRRWHLVTNDSIVHNSIRLNDQIFNTVRVCSNLYSANGMLAQALQYQRILDCNPMIILPDDNVKPGKAGGLEIRYALSFLREEVGKMYDGELVIAGQPEIKPWDVVLFNDTATGMAGPIVVKSVQHRFDSEVGYLTIIKPQALLIINEAATAGILAALQQFAVSIPAEIRGAWNDLTATNVAGQTANGTSLSNPAPGAAIQVGKEIAGVGLAGVAGTAGALAAGMVGVSVGAPAVAVGAAAAGLYLAGRFFYIASEAQGSNPLFLAPLSRCGRPWVGGLEGWGIADMHSLYNRKFENFWSFEIAPTIEGFKQLYGLATNLNPSQSKP